MLQDVGFLNFKSLVDMKVELAPLTVLVGANGAGKTTVLQGLSLLSEVLTNITKGEKKLDFSSFQTCNLSNALTLGSTEPDSYFLYTIDSGQRIAVAANHKIRGISTVIAKDASGAAHKLWSHGSGSSEGPTAALNYRSSVRLQLDVNALGRIIPEEPSYGFPRIEANGDGLAAHLSYLLSSRNSAVDRIERDLRAIVPFAGKVRVTRVPGWTIGDGVPYGHSLEVEVADRGFVPAQMLSDGTLLALGVLSILHGPSSPELLLLDDIERGLHPSAQRAFVDCLRGILKNNPKLQIVCSTHSPYFLDSLAPNEVVVLKIDSKGRSHCRTLADHPDWSEWKDSMTPGEFWSSVGESWVFEEEVS